MENTQQIPGEKNRNADIIYALFRIILGLILLVKGINFIFDTKHLMIMIQESRFSFAVGFLSYYISFAHLFGGVFIILGLITRFAIFLQLPVVLAAVILNLESQAFGKGIELAVSSIALILLVYFLIKGPGKISMDSYRKKADYKKP